MAFFDSSNERCARVVGIVETDPGPFVVSPYVVSELDHLLAARGGTKARLAALAELSGGAWELPQLEAADLREIRALIDRFQDRQIGIVDASLVILARRYRTNRLLTLNHELYRVIRTAQGGRSRCCPQSREPHRPSGSSRTAGASGRLHGDNRHPHGKGRRIWMTRDTNVWPSNTASMVSF